MTRPPYNAVIFDTDQTLVDSLSVMDQAFERTFIERYDIHAFITDLPATDYVGVSIDKIISTTLARKGFYDEKIAHEIGPTKTELDKQLIDLLGNARKKDLEKLAMPGAHSLLSILNNHGVHRASYTGATAAINTALLKASGLIDLLEVRSTSDDGINRVDILRNAYHKLCRQWTHQYAPQFKRTLVVGDSPKDVEAARDAGMKSMRITKGWIGDSKVNPLPTHTAYDLSEPEKIIKTVFEF